MVLLLDVVFSMPRQEIGFGNVSEMTHRVTRYICRERFWFQI